MVNLRRTLLIALGTGAIAAPLLSFAQQLVKAHRVGWLHTAPLDSGQEFIDETKRALRDRGHIEGKNIVFDFRSAEGDPTRMPRAAAELSFIEKGLPTLPQRTNCQRSINTQSK